MDLSPEVLSPRLMTNTTLLQKYCLSRFERNGGINFYNPKCLGFETFLKRNCVKKSATVVNMGKISLPSCVQTHFHEFVVCVWVDHPEKLL